MVGLVDEVPPFYWKNLSADFRKRLKVAHLKKRHYLLKQIRYRYKRLYTEYAEFFKKTKAIGTDKGDFLVRDKQKVKGFLMISKKYLIVVFFLKIRRKNCKTIWRRVCDCTQSWLIIFLNQNVI